MTYFKEMGSKRRLFEMVERVNRIKLNEDNSTSIVNYTFDELKNGELYITNSNTQTNDNETYVSLNCTNKNKDKIKLTFKVDLSGQSTDGVSEVSEILLTGFEFNSSNNQTTFELKDSDLDEFNNERKEEFFDAIQDYIDVETDSIAQDELYEEAIRNIDKYSYEGGTERMQTSKNYGDNKPTNPNLRVKSPETDKFIREDLEQAANSVTSKLDGKKKQILLDTIKNIKQSKGNIYKPTASEVHQEINKSKSVGNGHSVVSEEVIDGEEFGDVDDHEANMNDEYTDLDYGGFYVVTDIKRISGGDVIELTDRHTGEKLKFWAGQFERMASDKATGDNVRFLRTGHNGTLNDKSIENYKEARLKEKYKNDPEYAKYRTGGYNVDENIDNFDLNNLYKK